MELNRQDGLAYLGLMRYLLAVCVAAFHLWAQLFPDSGRNAVAGFFCISGFLITKIAIETYDGRPGAFLVNRFLRIYPIYWLCLLVAVLFGFSLPTINGIPLLAITFPTSIDQWLNQILIFTVSGSANKVIPQAWSLENELYFYFIIGLVTYRSQMVTYGCFIASLIYAVLAVLQIVHLWEFYWTPIGSAFLFFGGSSAYFISKNHHVQMRFTVAALSVGACTLLLTPPILAPIDLAAIPPQINIIISGIALIIFLAGARHLPYPGTKIERLLEVLGKTSYPLFLLHLTIALPIYLVVGIGPRAFVLTVIGCTLLSWLIVQYLENPIDRFRSLVRSRAVVRRCSINILLRH